MAEESVVVFSNNSLAKNRKAVCFDIVEAFSENCRPGNDGDWMLMGLVMGAGGSVVEKQRWSGGRSWDSYERYWD